MNFNDTPDEAAYRAQVRDWLLRTAPTPDELAGLDGLAAARLWQRRKAEGGYACITWPREWGGAGGTPIQQVIYQQEEGKVVVPATREYFEIGLGFCVPTLMSVGDPETKDRFLKPAVLGDEIWCQLFSEPAAGSDVAGIRTRAVRDGDGWLISGQKVWTSGAHFSDFGLILTRTDPTVPKHKGLTMFWVDMRQAGVRTQPVHQMSGARHFNEVFFDDVRVEDSQRLGKVGDGWRVSLVTLMNERLAGGGLVGPNHGEILKLAAQLPFGDGTALDDAGFREKLADWYVVAEGLKYTRFRTLTALSRGQTPGPEASIGKLVAASHLLDIANQAVELQDQYGIIDDPARAPLAAIFQKSLLHTPGLRIAGGTDEILKNIIAERVLGLPGDIRIDKDVAFKDLPTGV